MLLFVQARLGFCWIGDVKLTTTKTLGKDAALNGKHCQDAEFRTRDSFKIATDQEGVFGTSYKSIYSSHHSFPKTIGLNYDNEAQEG